PGAGLWRSRQPVLRIHEQGEGMACRSIRTLLCCGVAFAALSAPAPAQEPGCAPQKKRTLLLNDGVEEKEQTTGTAYRVEYKPVVCESFRYETVCEPREQLVTVVKRIPEYRTETRRVCHNEVCYEDRVVMKRCYETRQVTECVKKCVSKGHWECRTECCPPSCLDKLLHGCDACGHERTKKVWVHCPQYVDCPVTRCVKVCVEHPTVCKVKVCKPVFKEVQVQTCSYRCVEEKVVQKCMVSVCRKV